MFANIKDKLQKKISVNAQKGRQFKEQIHFAQQYYIMHLINNTMQLINISNSFQLKLKMHL